MSCPFFEKDKIYCKSYSLGVKIPAPYEIEHFCRTESYKFCCWYSNEFSSKEVMKEFKKLRSNWHRNKNSIEEKILSGGGK